MTADQTGTRGRPVDAWPRGPRASAKTRATHVARDDVDDFQRDPAAPAFLGRIVAVVTGPAPQSLALLTLPLAALALQNLLEVVLGRASGACRVHVAPLQRIGITADLYAYLHHHSQRFIGSNFAGAIASHIFGREALSVAVTLACRAS